MNVWQIVVLPIALGLLGFVEPCSLAAHGLFAGYLRRRPRTVRLLEALRFAVARAVVFGLLGLGAGLFGQAVVSVRATVNLALGLALITIGLTHAVRGGKVLPSLTPVARLMRGDRDRSLPLGLATGLSLPACATPLLAAALAGSISTAGLSRAFLSLFLFGVALSVPLGALIVWPDATERLARIGAQGRPFTWLTGGVIAALGVFIVLVER